MLCPNCETENVDDARFCKECGFPLSGAIARGAGAASPARSRPTYARPTESGRANATPAAGERSPERYRSKREAALDQERSMQSPAFSWEKPAPTFEEIASRRSRRAGRLEPDGNMPARSTAGLDSPASFNAPSAFAREVPGEEPYDEPAPEDVLASSFFEERDEGNPITIPLGAPHDTYKTESYAGTTMAFDRSYQPTSVMEPIDEEAEMAALRSRDFRAPVKQRRFTGKQVALVVGGIALVVAALVAVVGFALGIWGGIAVPNVVGMGQAEAEAVLSEDGFVPKVLQVKSDEIEGRVLVMDPGAGSFAEEGSEVVIHVATARTIPEVVGEEASTALTMLEEAGYGNVKQSVEYVDGPEGVVMSVTPEPGTRAKSSMEVSITVSENYKVPDVSGQSQEQASQTIADAGLSPSVSYVDTDQYPDGTVIGTDPAAGTKVSGGSSVAINVARARGVELTALANELLAVGSTVDIGGVSYQVESIDSVSYEGNDTVAFSITAKPFVTFFGETLFASSSQTVTGQVVYNEANEVVSIG